jgi:hypothetical protein
MKLRVKHVTKEITIAEVIEQIFNLIYVEDIPDYFLSDKEIVMQKIDSAICTVLDYDDNILLEGIFEEEDINRLKEKVFNIMYSIVKADKECE